MRDELLFNSRFRELKVQLFGSCVLGQSCAYDSGLGQSCSWSWAIMSCV